MSTAQATTVLDKIRSRGYWRVVVRPTTFWEHRVPRYDDLFSIVEKKSVQLRGWDYPHVDRSRPPQRGSDWVGQEFDWEHYLEVWRFHLSGLFTHLFAIHEDWRDQSSSWPGAPGWAWGRTVHYLMTIYTFVEIYEFAARLAHSLAGVNPMRVEIDVENLAGRRLTNTDGEIALFGEYRTEASAWTHRWEGSLPELIVRPRELAALAAQDFFAQFKLYVSLETLAKLQQRIAR